MSNKGKKLLWCDQCHRKRFCSRAVLNVDWYQWTCSQGHKWKSKISHIAKIVQVEIERFLPKIRELFERDDLFYREINRRR